MYFAIFPLHLSKVLRLPRKIDARLYEIFLKCNPLRKSAPWFSNISDKYVCCPVKATQNIFLQSFFKCSISGIIFGNATKPSHFAYFWKGIQSLAPATRKDNWNLQKGSVPGIFLHFLTSKCASRYNGVHFFDIVISKSDPKLVRFLHFDFKMCFSLQWRAFCRYRNFWKWSEIGM